MTGLEPATNTRRESRLALHQIVYGGTGMYTFELGVVNDQDTGC